MALFDVGSLPPWLIPRESPTDALVKGVQAGSAMAHNILAARNLALQEQESIIKQQNSLKIREGLAEFGAYMGSVTEWDNPKAEAGAWEVGKRHPWIMGTPAFAEGIQNFSKARLAKDQIEVRKEIAAVATVAKLAGMESQLEGIKFRAEMTAANAEANRDLRREVEVFKAAVQEKLLTQRGAQSLEQIEARGAQSLEQIEARGENAIELAREKDLLKQAGFDDLQIAEVGGSYFVRTPSGGLHPVPMFNAAEKTEHLSLVRRQEQLRKEIAALGTGKQDKAKAQSLDTDRLNLRTRQLQIEKDAVERLRKIKPTISGPPAASAPVIESQQLRYAREAVAAGVPKDRVAKKYKEETGLDYPE